MASIGSSLAGWFAEVRMQIPNVFAGQFYTFQTMDDSITVCAQGTLPHSRGTSTRARCKSTGMEFDIRRLRLAAKAGNTVTLDMLETLEREADLATSVGSQANVVRCFASLVENQGVEHCRLLLCDPCRCDLAEHLQIHGGALPIGDVVDLGEQLSLGLRHLHSLDILCGGLNTQGVLLGCDGKWKLLGDLRPTAVLPISVHVWRQRLHACSSEHHSLLPPEIRLQAVGEEATQTLVTFALDIWMLGALLAQVSEGVDSKCISSARTGNAVLVASQDLLLCPFATRFWMLLHWLLATEPSQRPSSRRLVDILHSLSGISPQDLLIEMPEYARFHCEGSAAAAARKLAFSSVANMGKNRNCAAGLPLEILRMSMADSSDVDQLYHNCGLELGDFPVSDAGQSDIPLLVPVLCDAFREAHEMDTEDFPKERDKPRSRCSSDYGLDTDESTEEGSSSGDESTNVSDSDSVEDGCSTRLRFSRIARQRRPATLDESNID